MISVASGKGGVGKTTVAASIAWSLAKDHRVAILDCDLTGADLPIIFDSYDKPEFIVKRGKRARIKPLEITVDGRKMKMLSLGLMIPDRAPVLWTEDESREAVQQMLNLTNWDCDYLVVDCPPGSGPEVQEIMPKVDYAIVVMIDSKLAFGDVERALEMMREYGTPILGEVRNMDRLICSCGKIHRPYNDGVDIGIPRLMTLDFVENSGHIIDLDDSLPTMMDAMKDPLVLKKHSIIGSMKRNLFQNAITKWLSEED